MEDTGTPARSSSSVSTKKRNPWAVKLFFLIVRFKKWIIAIWLSAGLVSAFFALDLTNETIFQYLPPNGSQSAHALNAVKRYFPDFAFQDIELIMLEYELSSSSSTSSERYDSVDNPISTEICQRVNRSLSTARHSDLLLAYTALYQVNMTEWSRTFYSDASTYFVSEDQTIMITTATLNVNGVSQSELNSWVDDSRKTCRHLSHEYSDLGYKSVALTGGLTIFNDMMDTVQKDITGRDIVMMPLIFAFMAYVIGSWKLVLIPGVTLGVTIVVSFSIFIPIARWWLSVNPMAPSIMMFISMALSVDYSLFLLSRFSSELRRLKQLNRDRFLYIPSVADPNASSAMVSGGTTNTNVNPAIMAVGDSQQLSHPGNIQRTVDGKNVLFLSPHESITSDFSALTGVSSVAFEAVNDSNNESNSKKDHNEKVLELTVASATLNMIEFSGHVVALSGCVLMICYMGLGLFPVAGMDTAGYGACVSIFICIWVNITFTSSVILTFPRFFGTLEMYPPCLIPLCYRICCCRGKPLHSGKVKLRCCFCLPCPICAQTCKSEVYKTSSLVSGVDIMTDSPFQYSIGASTPNQYHQSHRRGQSATDLIAVTNHLNSSHHSLADAPSLDSNPHRDSAMTAKSSKLSVDSTIRTELNSSQSHSQQVTYPVLHQSNRTRQAASVFASPSRDDIDNPELFADTVHIRGVPKTSESDIFGQHRYTLTAQTTETEISVSEYGGFMDDSSHHYLSSAKQIHVMNLSNSLLENSDDLLFGLNHGDDAEDLGETINRNCYWTLTQYTTSSPLKFIIPLIIFGLMSPVIYQLTKYEDTLDFSQMFPRNTQSTKSYNLFMKHFPPSVYTPFYILSVPRMTTMKQQSSFEDEWNIVHLEESESNNHNNGTIWNQTYFDDLCGLARTIIIEQGYNASDFAAINMVPEQYIKEFTGMLSEEEEENVGLQMSDDNGEAGLYCMNVHVSYQLIHGNLSEDMFENSEVWSYIEAYRFLYNSTVNSEENAILTPMSVNFNPWASDAEDHAEDLRHLKNDYQRHEKNNGTSNSGNSKYYLHCTLYWEYDSLIQTYNRLPWGLSLIVMCVFLVIGMSFRVVFLPLRLFFAVVIPICFVYGCTTAVYVLGWMDWVHWNSVQSEKDGIYWMLPVFTVTILIGLALDYEVFLFARVFEYRSKGYTTRSSILMAVSSTGPIISAAGVVMSMAFFGLMLEEIPQANQMGFVFVFGVLIDTFIIRPLLTPSILSLADWLNWWPLTMPDEKGLRDVL